MSRMLGSTRLTKVTSFSVFLATWFLLVSFVSSHGNHGGHQQQAQNQQGQQQQAQQQQQQGHNHQQQARTTNVHNVAQDKEHIQEHLKEAGVAVDPTQNMSERDLQFHYFKVHDLDNNDKLDGIELANAMAHYHDEETGEKAEDYTEAELASMVDQILDEDDLNKDGYIDYPEFIQSQQREEAAEGEQKK